MDKIKITNIDSLTSETTEGIRLSADIFIHLRKNNDETFFTERTRLDTLGICFVERGSYRIKVNSETYRLTSGDLLVCHPNDFYEDIYFSKDFNGLIIFASADVIADTIDKKYLLQCLESLKSTPKVSLKEGARKLMKEYRSVIEAQLAILNIPNNYDAIILVCKAILTDIFNYMLIELPAKSVMAGSRSEVIYQSFINLLVSTPEKPHDHKWYADQLCVSPKYLSSICMKESGKTALEWIKEYIMNDAQRYLIATDLSVKEISSRLRFSNFAFFCKCVKRHFHQTPLQIRGSSYRSNTTEISPKS